MVRSLNTGGIKRHVRLEHSEITKVLLPRSYLLGFKKFLKISVVVQS